MIACVLLTTPDRTEMNRRAIRSFREQTYDDAILVVCSTDTAMLNVLPPFEYGECFANIDTPKDTPLCTLMNLAMERALSLPTYGKKITHLAKWDSDDWSAPGRLADQMTTLERTGAWVTGYNSMPLYCESCRDCNGRGYGETAQTICHRCNGSGHEVLIYSNPNSNYALGTSLLMKREAWEQFPFPDTTQRKKSNPRGTGSDSLFVMHWAQRGRISGCSGIRNGVHPMMIAGVHSGNTSLNLARFGTKPAGDVLAANVRKIMGES